MKNGIAMVTLVVTIAVMLTLVSVITYTGINTANTSKKMAFASEIKMVQECIDSYRTNNEGNFPTSDFVTIDLSNASIDVKKQFTDNGEEIIENKVYLSKIDYTKLELNSLNRGLGQTSDDIYVLSTKSGIVYYAKGLKIGNITYYTLTYELKNLLSYNQKSNEVSISNPIVFKVSTTDWINSGKVECSVKVPNNYSSKEPTFNGNIILDVQTSSEGEYITHKFNIDNNGIIEIKYNDGKEDKTASYTINNFDKDIPTVSISKISNSNPDKKSYKIDANDKTSGVKVIKYDIGNIANDNISNVYFYSNGIQVKDNIIQLDNDVSYITVYVEDKAGNSQVVAFEV
ncbi:unknown [Clostridium sp. CAG:465]|nr:unknown [Clostridium sp. CAG:465]